MSLPPFARWGLILSGAYDLWMTDIRTFGTAALYQEGEPLDKGFEALGPEPLDDAMTGTYLKERARHKKPKLNPLSLISPSSRDLAIFMPMNPFLRLASGLRKGLAE